MPKINSLEVVHQDTNKDSYDNLHDILVALKDAVGLIKEGKDYSVNKEIIDGKARAAYEVLLEMYVNDKEAFARRLETLTAEFGTSIAKIIEEWTVYASATEAYARKIEEVSAKAFQNEARVTEEMYARVTADEAVAKLVTTLRADFENAQTRSKASIREEQIARANADEALASRSFVMEASIADNTAMITEEQLVRATADEALASNITSLTATVATNTASILTEQTTRANADSALATQINTVSATAGNKNRTYVQTTAPTGSTLVPLVSGDLWFDSDDNYKLYRYSGSTWDAVDDSRIAATAAAVSTETSARVTADSALGTQINSVVARLDTGDFATVKTTSEASALKLQTRANLVSEITNWTLNGGLTLSTNTNGLVALSSNSGTYIAESPFFAVDAGQTYTITGDTRKVGSTGSVYFDIQFYNASGTLLKDGAQNPIYTAHAFSTDDTNRNDLAVADTAPTGATQAKARFVATSVDTSGVGFRQVKVERGDLPATPFSQETTVNYASAKWGVTVDANGYAAGIALNASSTGTSEFVVAANKFRVKKPDGTDGISWNGTNSRLDISGDVYANNFYGNVVGTGNINDNAVTQPSFVSVGVTSVQSTETAYLTLNISLPVASTIFASSSMGMSFPSGVNDSVFNLKINGTTVATMHTGGAYVQSIALSGGLSVAAGTSTITVTGYKTGGATVEIESGTLYGMGIKR